MKKLSTVLIAALFATTAVSADKARKECIKSALASRVVAYRDCRAKPNAEREECRKGAEMSFEAAKKLCESSASTAPSTGPSETPAMAPDAAK